jgi:hypothetical protein
MRIGEEGEEISVPAPPPAEQPVERPAPERAEPAREPAKVGADDWFWGFWATQNA